MKLKYVMIAAAASLTACSPSQPSYDNTQSWAASQDTRICRDNAGRRIDDRYCTRSQLAGGSSSNAFMWYYIGRGGYVPPVGQTYTPDSYGRSTPVAGKTYTSAPKVISAVPGMSAKGTVGSVSRGGFGSSAHGFSSGS